MPCDMGAAGHPRTSRLHCTQARGTALRNRQAVASSLQKEYPSIIPEVEKFLDSDEESLELQSRLKAFGQERLTELERRGRQQALNRLQIPPWSSSMRVAGVSELRRAAATVLQLNIGLYCNQACTHCHVESSPRRTEMMDHRTAERCLELLKASPSVRTLDITGGAPELNSEFMYLVEEAAKMDVEIIDRCNLTVLVEPGQEHLAAFLAEHKVRVVASMPCYSKENVDKQRGGGVFNRSIAGLKRLNAVGYGLAGSDLVLDLVYNPGGAFLAPSQADLEPAYKRELREGYGVEFNTLMCLNNMPIKRFWEYLERREEVEEYMQLLAGSFNAAAGERVMCRDTVSVAWDGHLFDCDFNQQLALGMTAEATVLDIFSIASLQELEERQISCGNHCYGCTAGAGSSCQGQ